MGGALFSTILDGRESHFHFFRYKFFSPQKNGSPSKLGLREPGRMWPVHAAWFADSSSGPPVLSVWAQDESLYWPGSNIGCDTQGNSHGTLAVQLGCSVQATCTPSSYLPLRYTMKYLKGCNPSVPLVPAAICPCATLMWAHPYVHEVIRPRV